MYWLLNTGWEGVTSPEPDNLGEGNAEGFTAVSGQNESLDAKSEAATDAEESEEADEAGLADLGVDPVHIVCNVRVDSW